MASDHRLTSVAVAVESSFAELDSDSVPDASGLTFVGLPCVRASFFDTGAERINDLDLTRGGHYDILKEPVVVINNTGGALYGAGNGTPFRFFQGDIELTFRVNNIGDGTAFSAHTDLPWVKLLSSSFTSVTGGAATDDVSGAPASASSHTPTTLANFKIGMGCMFIRDNVAEYNVVADVTGPTVDFAYNWPGGILSDGDTIRLSHTLAPIAGTSPSTVALRFDMDSRRMYAFGCRVANPRFELGDDGALTCTVTVKPAGILRDDSNAALSTYSIPDGHVVNKFGATQYVSANARGASAAGLSVSLLGLRDWSVDIDTQISPEEGSAALSSMLGMTDQLIQGSFPTVTLQGQPNTTLEDMFRLREERGVVLGYGPAGEGEGMAIAIMAASRKTSDMAIAEENGQQALTTVLQAGEWTLDTGSSAAADTSFRIILPL